jgi:hypothetical protein
VQVERVLVTPAAFSSVLWRVVAVSGDRVHEGFHSLLDAPGPMRFDAFDRGAGLDAELQGNESVPSASATSATASTRCTHKARQVLITDLRMGLEPNYTFSFVVAERTRRAAAAGLAPAGWHASRGRPLPAVGGSPRARRVAAAAALTPQWRSNRALRPLSARTGP